MPLFIYKNKIQPLMFAFSNIWKAIKHSPHRWCLIALFIYAFTAIYVHSNKAFYKNPDAIVIYDATGYYAHLQWWFTGQDVDFTLHSQRPHQNFLIPITTKNQQASQVNKYSTGVALLQVPFFLIGHVVAGYQEVHQDGLWRPYMWWTTFGALLYAWMALVLVWLFLRPHFEDKVIAVVLLGLGLGTNWWNYTINAPFMSHNYSCFLFALTLLFSQKWYQSGKWSHFLVLAIGVALIANTRLPNLVYGLVIAFGGVYDWPSLKTRVQFLAKNWVQLLVGLYIIILSFFPQLYYWRQATGYWFFNAYANNGEGFFWTQPLILEILIGYRKGWLIYTPLMFLALAGFIQLYRQHRAWFPSIALYTLVNIYVVSCWGCWWYGGSFGMRALVEAMIPLAFPLAAFLQWAQQRRWSRAFFTGAVVFFIGLNMLHIYQQEQGILHWDSMSRATYWHSFGVFPPYSEEFRAAQDSLWIHPNTALESKRIERVSTIW